MGRQPQNVTDIFLETQGLPWFQIKKGRNFRPFSHSNSFELFIAFQTDGQVDIFSNNAIFQFGLCFFI